MALNSISNSQLVNKRGCACHRDSRHRLLILCHGSSKPLGAKHPSLLPILTRTESVHTPVPIEDCAAWNPWFNRRSFFSVIHLNLKSCSQGKTKKIKTKHYCSRIFRGNNLRSSPRSPSHSGPSMGKNSPSLTAKQKCQFFLSNLCFVRDVANFCLPLWVL